MSPVIFPASSIPLKKPSGSAEVHTMEPSWEARAFAALDRAEGTATVLLSEDLVIRWASSSWLRIFGFDPVGVVGIDLLHPDDVKFASSVIAHHHDHVDLYAAGPLPDESLPPSGEIRLRHGSGRWLKCLLRVDNHLRDPNIGALAVHVVRPIDPSGLARAIDAITRGAPVEESLTAILGYMEEDGVRPNRGPWGIVWRDANGDDRVTTNARADVAAVMFGSDATNLPRSPEQVTITFVYDLPPGRLRAMAERMGMKCLWTVRIGEPHDELGLVLSWSAYDFALELRPHMHFTIGCDVVRLALHDHRRLHAIRRHAVTDPLTGVLNRAGLLETYEAMMAVPDTKIGALFIDLDDFKQINDEHGHGVGDQVLAEVASRLRSACRKRDIVSRLGGDEFVILCRLVSDDGISAVAGRVEHLLLPDVLTDAGPLRIRASVGVGISTGEGDLGQLLRDADHALYRAKRDAKAAADVPT